jgi:hypothetical protein
MRSQRRFLFCPPAVFAPEVKRGMMLVRYAEQIFMWATLEKTNPGQKWLLENRCLAFYVIAIKWGLHLDFWNFFWPKLARRD